MTLDKRLREEIVNALCDPDWDYTVEEIAAEIGCDVETIRNIVNEEEFDGFQEIDLEEECYGIHTVPKNRSLESGDDYNRED